MDYLALTLPGAQNIQPPKDIPTGGLSVLSKALNGGITIFIIATVIITIIFIVWSGFQWAYSGGDKSKVAAARGRMTWAVIGLIIALAAVFIINILGSFFGVKLLSS
jgi:magnesium-transporting ATPase (P-type)